MTDLPTFSDVEAAARRIEGQAVKTPLLRSDALDEATGGRVFVKAECLQRTGSFKFRGAYNRLAQLSAEERERGVVAFSSGNHAQGVALAARLLGIPAIIVMPADAPAIKIEATRGYGAEVVAYDRYTQSREEIARAIGAEKGCVVVPSYDDFHIIAGQGTAGLEAAHQLREVGAEADVLLCPASGGGYMAGYTLVFSELSPRPALYAVEPRGYEDHAASLKAGRPTPVAPDASGRDVPANPAGPSLCDALLAPQPGDLPFAINGPRLAGALAVTDEEALTAIAFAFRHLKIVLEPGGAVALAALLTGKLDVKGHTAVAVASGGNVDPAVFVRAIG
ncbi:MAG: threonine ammonia-lyase [Caulobacteraceae bacterium]